MQDTLSNTKPRIEVVDALRGFAVMCILMIHNLEHFNFYDFPTPSTPMLQTIDTWLWDIVFFLVSGKAYAIFSLLFGLSFFIQYNNALKRGTDFRLRFMWRLVLLFGFGCLNGAFFPGDILVLYSIVGFVLPLCCKLSMRALTWVMIVCMLQPLEWLKVIVALVTGNTEPEPSSWLPYCEANGAFLPGSDFWATMLSNLTDGQLFSFFWAWEYGRFFQTAGLFLLGMIVGRIGLFANLGERLTLWKNVLIGAAAYFCVSYALTSFGALDIDNPLAKQSLNTIFSSLQNLSFMMVLVSLFALAWHKWSGRALRVFIPYGKMSLTNYISQSIIGSFIYFGWGLSLYDDLTHLESFGVALLIFVVQLMVCTWHLKHFRQGPLEYLWKKATWIFSQR